MPRRFALLFAVFALASNVAAQEASPPDTSEPPEVEAVTVEPAPHGAVLDEVQGPPLPEDLAALDAEASAPCTTTQPPCESPAPNDVERAADRLAILRAHLEGSAASANRTHDR